MTLTIPAAERLARVELASAAPAMVVSGAMTAIARAPRYRSRAPWPCAASTPTSTAPCSGSGGSLFRDAEGNFSHAQARALEACHRAEVEVVIKSGRREAQVLEDARLIGQTSYIYEAGCAIVIDGERTS